MTISHKIRISSPREVIFSLYEDVASWPEWDRETAEVFLPEGLQPGATGWLRPRKGPKARVRVAGVVAGRSFTMEGSLPLCRMYFDHDLEEEGGQVTATHSVRFCGPLSFLFRRVIGREIDAALPNTLRGLKRSAESKILSRCSASPPA